MSDAFEAGLDEVLVHEGGYSNNPRDPGGMRRDYYRSLPTFKTFGKGWLRRCDEVQAVAEGLC